ncbi:MAG: DUF1669 domain-containing protein [Spirochaetes bacterium]|nr:DUF1669 domain-containing protein [Spirochaetota bacterium]
MKKYYKIISTVFVFFFFYSDFLYSGDWWKIYFTSPYKKGHALHSMDSPEHALIRNIKSANEYFYGAFFDINLKSVVQALINAHERGIDVKLVVEKDNAGKREIKELAHAGIKITTDNGKGLMHNKFAVIDGRLVWTGSYNLTYNDEYKNNNNVIEIRSEYLAKIYMDEFSEMFDNRIFGNKTEYMPFAAFKKKYYVKIGGTDINVYFSPEDNIERIIIDRIKKAKQSIHFMAFSFTSNKLADELIRMNKKGINVYGIIEKTGSNSRDSEYVKLKLESIQVKLDKNKNRMHHKVIIIDEHILITGSYNFSKNLTSSIKCDK